MKLLLTSNGICNKSMVRVLKNWVKEDLRITFVPTAANMADGNKDWLIKNYDECAKLGQVEIADIAAVDKKIWLPRLKWANVIVFGGGNSDFLLKMMEKSGLKKELPNLLKTRIYVGISAGSIVAGTNTSSSSQYIYGTNKKKAPKALCFIDYTIRSHFNSKKFPKLRDKNIQGYMKNVQGKMYALDDQSALSVDNGKITVISEGKWKLYT